MTARDKINETRRESEIGYTDGYSAKKRESVAKFIWFSFKSPHLAFMYSVILHFLNSPAFIARPLDIKTPRVLFRINFARP